MRREILYVIRSLNIGGSEKHLFNLVRHLPRNQFSCHLFSLESEGDLIELFKNAGVSIYSTDLKEGEIHRAPWKVPASGFNLLQIINTIRPDIIHAFLPLSTFLAALGGWVHKVPLIVTSRRGLSTYQDRHRVLKYLDRMANRWSHFVTVNSQAVWDDVACRNHIDTSKLIRIYNGVDTRLFEKAQSDRLLTRKELGLSPRQNAIICIANLIGYKGHHDLVRAARIVVDKLPETTFLLVGEDRGIRKDLEQKVKSLRLENHVKILGLRIDIPQLLSASDLSVSASHEEGFSNAILESMAAGLPIVATDVGGTPEAVIDGETGWLVPPKQPMLFAEKIMDLIEDPEKARCWGKRGKERTQKHFTMEKMVHQYLKLYDSVQE